MSRKGRKRKPSTSAVTVQRVTPEPSGTSAPSSAGKLVSASWSGPLPPPNILAHFEDIQPGLAAQIIDWTEKQSAHRQTIEAKALDAEIEELRAGSKRKDRGQKLGFTIGCLALILGSAVALHGQQVAGGFIGTGGVVGLVTVFVTGHAGGRSQPETETLPAKSGSK